MIIFNDRQQGWAKAIGIMVALLPLIATAQLAENGLPGSVERVVWKKIPIMVALSVGEERQVRFPDSVSVGVPEQLTALLRAQSINGTLYLTASQPFPTTRVLVRSDQSGPLYVMDVSAALPSPDDPSLPAMQILLKQRSSESSNNDLQNPITTQWGYVRLTRFAAQQLYAPLRLLTQRPGIVRVPVSADPVTLLRGGAVEAYPIGSWRAGTRTVTAVKLVNRSKEAVVLDPRQLRGRWLAATFQHNRLLPAGSEADTTSVYLVSDRPFVLSL